MHQKKKKPSFQIRFIPDACVPLASRLGPRNYPCSTAMYKTVKIANAQLCVWPFSQCSPCGAVGPPGAKNISPSRKTVTEPEIF